MTTLNVLNTGDEVVLNIDPDCRILDPNCPDVHDGTKGVAVGFRTSTNYEPRVPVQDDPPGVYELRGGVLVRLEDGSVVTVDEYSISLADRTEWDRRLAELRKRPGGLDGGRVRVGDLPETKFYEGDKVGVRFPDYENVQEMVIRSIDYVNINHARSDGSPRPFYEVEDADGGSYDVEESQIELIERGNVWKYYNRQPLSFVSLKEEALFFQRVGQTEKVCNPRTKNYDWSRPEIDAAIREGIVHGFSLLEDSANNRSRLKALRYKDEELGQRVAAAMMSGFCD